METWKTGNLENWILKTCKFGKIQIRKNANLEKCKVGNMQIGTMQLWKNANFEKCKFEKFEIRKNGNREKRKQDIRKMVFGETGNQENCRFGIM